MARLNHTERIFYNVPLLKQVKVRASVTTATIDVMRLKFG